MKEIWKDVKGYEGKYLISNTGKVKSLTRNRLLKPVIQKGYMYIHLCKNSKDKAYLLHRLVAKHFVSNPDNLPEVNHKNEDKVNNDASNLEWCDAKYNSNYGTRGERISKGLKEYHKRKRGE